MMVTTSLKRTLALEGAMNETDEQTLGDLPPSAKLVLVVLEHEGTLTQKQLVEKTRLSGRTVRYALNQLTEINAISEQISFMDARQTLYTTTHSISLPETA
jgi:DNA-binding MarR family transcriptional regulator